MTRGGGRLECERDLEGSDRLRTDAALRPLHMQRSREEAHGEGDSDARRRAVRTAREIERDPGGVRPRAFSPPDGSAGVSQQRSGVSVSAVASVESFAPALRRYFAKRAPRSDIDDLVQEVLLRMQGRRREADIANLQGYVFTVAANVLKETRWRPGPFRAFEDGACEVSDEITPERIVAARLDAMRLMAAIDALPGRTREIFVAHRFEEMTYGAIASLFGISVSAVEKHIMAALKSLTATVNGIDG